MGFFSRIKEAAKKVAGVVKKTVQTIIPGGSKGFLAPAVKQTGSPVFKPSESKEAASFASKSSAQRVQERKSPVEKAVSAIARDIKGQTFTHKLSGEPKIDPKTGEPVPGLIQGTLPIGPAGISLIGKTTSLDDFLQAGKISKTGDIVNKFQKNVKSAGLIKSLSTKIINSATWKGLATATLGLVIIDKILERTLGGKNFGEFVGMEEAIQTVSYPTTLAYQAGDWESYELGKEARDELLQDDSFWATVKSYIPFVNLGSKLEDFRKAAITGGVIMDKLAEDKRIQEETGETDDEKWARVKAEQADQDKIAVDYYNEQRKLMVEWEREAEVDARNADAKFWRKEREAQMKKEEEDRKAIADFWEAYRKQLQKLNEDSRPSNLNFGLI